MSTTAPTPNEATQEALQTTSVDAIAEGLEKTELQSDTEDTQRVAQQGLTDARPLIVYTRMQLIRLSKSPLVKVPDGMPAFRSWFGEVNEQSMPSAKKDPDAVTTNGMTRERRYRRDAEDGDGTTRPQFRSALSQPSQMGNFRHQPLRTSDRDKDRDTDLRSLSDRYDRDKATRGDRVGLPSHSTLLRNRDRDSAPHLAPDRETQRSVARKRNGESKEDWRRGAEPPRAGRDENHTRRDRDDRERQRSRARDSSKTRDSPPSTRRDRDDQRRDRDRDRFNEADEDNKRWREDGKRDGKPVPRREKDRLGREKDGGRDLSRDAAEEREGWTISEDKKRGARDRRNDDGREREDKKEREREKEPAWMETYIPPAEPSAGILGAKNGDGEMDSIQAWKKDMKEREMKAKGLTTELPASTTSLPQNVLGEGKNTTTPTAPPEGQLDEIQLFKLMMKQEEKKRTVSSDGKGAADDRPSDAVLQSTESGIPSLMRIRDGRGVTNHIGSPGTTSSENGVGSSIDPLLVMKPSMSVKTSVSAISLSPSPSALSCLGALPNSAANTISPTVPRSDSNGPRLLALKSTDSVSIQGDSVNKDATAFDPPRHSRLLAFGAQNTKVTAQPSPQRAAAAVQMGRLQQIDSSWPNQGRTSVSPSIPLSVSQHSGVDRANLQQQLLAGGQLDINAANNISSRSGLDSATHSSMIFDNPSRLGHIVDLNRDFNNYDANRSSIPLSASERTAFKTQPDSLHHLADSRRNPTPPMGNYGVSSPISPYENQMGGGQNSYSTGKGSRMAKHFERQRDQVNVGRNVPNAAAVANGMMSNRQEQQSFNGPVGNGESRNIQDLLTMLNNSAQAQRGQSSQNLSQPQIAQSIHMGPSNNSLGRHDPVLDVDDGRFVPDGLVPGLRPAPPPGSRNRELNNGSLFANQLDESLALNARLGPHQRAGMEQLFAGQIPSQYNGQGPNTGRGGLAFQQQALRGGPSPINNFNPVQGAPQQRLPPGLANLGARPPHEPSQYLGGGVGNFGGVPSQFNAGLQHTNNPQSFNQFQTHQNQGLGMVGNQGLRGQPTLGQLGSSIGNGMNGMDFRGGPSQNQMLGLGGPNLGQGMRGGPGFSAQQLHGQNQLPPSMNIRQQQNLQPQMLQQLLPQQQMQGVPQGQPNPSELMALLMGGVHRE